MDVQAPRARMSPSTPSLRLRENIVPPWATNLTLSWHFRGKFGVFGF